MATVQYTPEEQTHIAVIKHLISVVGKVRDLQDRSTIIIQLFDYMIENSLPLTQNYPNFKKTIISKCYEFKRDAPSYLGLVAATDRLLKALGEPLEEPMSPELILFVGVVKQFPQLKNLSESRIRIREMQRIFSIYKNRIPEMRGMTLEEKIEYYIVINILKPNHPMVVAEYRKKQDMKRFAATKGLALTNAVMPQYREWDDALGLRLNRYEKMMHFIEENKNLFAPLDTE